MPVSFASHPGYGHKSALAQSQKQQDCLMSAILSERLPKFQVFKNVF